MEAGAEAGEEGQAGPTGVLTPPPGSPDADRIVGAGERTELSERLAARAATIVVVAVGCWLTRSFWVPGSYVVGFDTYAYSGPNTVITEQAFRDGRLPLVNDMIFGGAPHLGNPQTGSLYPPRLLTLVLETNRAMGLLVALHVILLGVGMRILARRLGVGDVGAATAGVVAMASGAVLTKSVQFEQILVLAWAPLLVAAIHAVVTTARPWRAVAALALVTATTLLAGHPQLVYQTMFLAVASTIGFTIGDERWRRLGHVATGALLGALLALPQLVAAVVATADSSLGAGRDIDLLVNPALSLDPTLLARALLGTVQDRDPAGFAGGFESIASVGVVAGVLAVVGWTVAFGSSKTRAWSISLTVAAVVAVLWSFGERSALFRIAWDVLPGFDLARASARWLVVPVLVIALHAGVGAQALMDRARPSHLVAVVGGMAVVAGAHAVGLVDVADRRSALIWVATASLGLALVAARVFGYWWRLPMIALVGLLALGAAEVGLISLHSIPQSLRTDTPFTAHTAPATEWLAGRDGFTIALTDDGAGPEYEVPGLRPNANVLADVRSIDGYDGGVQVTERWAAALRRLSADPLTDLPMRNSLEVPIDARPLGRLGVRYVLLDRDRPASMFLTGWDGPRFMDDWFEVWENPWWVGDAVAWRAATVLYDGGDGGLDAPDLLRTRLDEFRSSVLVDELTSPLDCAPPTPCPLTGLTLDRRSAEHLVVRTDLPDPSLVVVHRQALPGWDVEVDGRNARSVLVDGLFLGVEVPAGPHEITWRYRQPWLGTSALVTAAALLAVGALAAAGWRPQRPGRSPSPGRPDAEIARR